MSERIAGDERMSALDRVISVDRDPGRPRSLDWHEYFEYVTALWNEALAEHAHDESGIQAHLERFPCLLPLESGRGHHGPWLGVISQPPLLGVETRVPDFMWIERNSAEVTAVCVEIERPDKMWFREDGAPTADLSQAQDQLDEWRAWFERESADNFFRTYALPPEWLSRRVFSQRYILIYGRVSEFETRNGSRHRGTADRLNRKRAVARSPDEMVMTYDGLYPSESHRRLPTLKRVGSDLKVISVPPTFETGEHIIELAQQTHGLEDAIREMELSPSPERLEYLVHRVEFWRGCSVYGQAYSPGFE